MLGTVVDVARCLEVDVERFAIGGDGIGHLPDGRVVFVAGALPGERAGI
ncbi:MAG: TRAM domain-containing protein, partial [Acidimicrobiales bacterium]